jgi:hypothetical protein
MSSISSDSLASTALQMQADRTREDMSISMMRQQKQSDDAMVAMLDQASREAAPAPGTGQLVDRRA